MLKPVWDCKLHGEFENIFDCMIAESLLGGNGSVGTVEQTMMTYGVSSLAELAEKQKEKLQGNDRLSQLYYKIELPMAKILWQMEKRGITLDASMLKKIGSDLDAEIDAIKNNIQKETGAGLNINSSVQLGQFLAETKNIPLGKTKTGKYATNEGELMKFRSSYPIINEILNYREKSKLRSTYVDSLIEKVGGDGRLHTTYSQTGVATGRLSSSNPNLQNIPVTSTAGLRIKSCFIASPGCSLISFDYSQQELRILAHLSAEPALIDAFNKGQDVHIVTASKLFHVSYDKVTKEQRTVGKTINFGIIYGMSGFGMSYGLNIPLEEADAFIAEFYASYPKIKSYFDAYLAAAAKNNFVETLLGRRRTVFDRPGRKFIDNTTRRILLNYPIQGSAADLMKKAMIDIDTKILQKNPVVHLLLQIHDDLVFEIPDSIERRDILIDDIKQVLCSAWKLAVPLDVDVKIGKSWGKMEKYSG